jgi:acetylornithine deacetylase/succinyl-diaminopimelate desuccinylase-like protein
MSQPPDDAARRRRHRNERIAAVTGIAILLAGLFAFIRWNEAEEERFRRERTYIPPELQMTSEVRALQHYVSIDTSNPPGNEIAGARFLAAILVENGVHPEIIEPAPGRASLYARIRGKRAGEGLLLLNHIDVIPADPAKWQRPPFQPTIELTTMYGRGTLDMKSLAICQLAAFLDVARSGRQPERDIVFLAAADEETGGALGVGWIVKHRPDVFEGIRYAIGEGGITEMVADELKYFAIEIGSKQYAKVTLSAKTREPLETLRWALQGYFTATEPDRILPEVREYFQFLAPTRISVKEELADVDAAVANGNFRLLFKPYRDLTQTIINMHWPQRAGDRWTSEVYMLILPDEEPRERIAWLERMAAPHGIAVRVDVAEPKTPLSSHHTPLFGIIADEAAREYRARTGTLILHQATTDSRYLRRLGIHCYGLSPYPVDAFQSATIHGVNEQVRLDRFQRGVELVRRIVRRWAFGR